jgi:hypothetical protein
MSEIKMTVNEFKQRNKGIEFVKSCIKGSDSSMYEDGCYHFRYIIDNGNIVFAENRPENPDSEWYGIFTNVDDSLFEGCENIEDFENASEHQEDLTEICERLYNIIAEKIDYEV